MGERRGWNYEKKFPEISKNTSFHIKITFMIVQHNKKFPYAPSEPNYNQKCSWKFLWSFKKKCLLDSFLVSVTAWKQQRWILSYRTFLRRKNYANFSRFLQIWFLRNIVVAKKIVQLCQTESWSMPIDYSFAQMNN